MRSSRTSVPQLRQSNFNRTLPMVLGQQQGTSLHTVSTSPLGTSTTPSTTPTSTKRSSMSTIAMRSTSVLDSYLSARKSIPILGMGFGGSDDNNNNNDNDDNGAGIRRNPGFDDDSSSSSKFRKSLPSSAKRLNFDSYADNTIITDDANYLDAIRSMEGETPEGGSGGGSSGVGFGSGLFALLGLLFGLQDLLALLFGPDDDDDDDDDR